MSIRTVSYIGCILSALYILSVIMPGLGKQKYDLVYRRKALTVWVENVKAYENETGKVPSSLYEVYLHLNKQKQEIAVPIVLYRNLTIGETEKLRSNPEYFLKLIKYTLVISGNDWYVKEDYSDTDSRSKEMVMYRDGSTRKIN